MRDLSDNKEVKNFCKFICTPPYHEQNLQRIENSIARMKATAGHIEWDTVSSLCRDYIRVGVGQYSGRYDPVRFTLKDKILMADNLLEYFKNKHGHK